MKKIIFASILILLGMLLTDVITKEQPKNLNFLELFLNECNEESKKNSEEKKESKYYKVSFKEGYYFIDTGLVGVPEVRLKKGAKYQLEQMCKNAYEKYKGRIPIY